VYVLQIVVSPFILFLLAIVLSVLLRYTDSYYPFKLFTNTEIKVKEQPFYCCSTFHSHPSVFISIDLNPIGVVIINVFPSSIKLNSASICDVALKECNIIDMSVKQTMDKFVVVGILNYQ